METVQFITLIAVVCGGFVCVAGLIVRHCDAIEREIRSLNSTSSYVSTPIRDGTEKTIKVIEKVLDKFTHLESCITTTAESLERKVRIASGTWSDKILELNRSTSEAAAHLGKISRCLGADSEALAKLEYPDFYRRAGNDVPYTLAERVIHLRRSIDAVGAQIERCSGTVFEQRTEYASSVLGLATTENERMVIRLASRFNDHVLETEMYYQHMISSIENWLKNGRCPKDFSDAATAVVKRLRERKAQVS